MNEGAYYKLFKNILETLGTDSACVFAVMNDFNEYAKREGQLTEDGYFFLTAPTLEKKTLLKRWKQDAAIERLKDNGYISYKLKGMPAKRFYKVVGNQQACLLATSYNKEHNYKEHNYKEHTTTTNNKVVETYQQAFGVVNSLLFEDMKDTAERFGEEWTLQALKIAIANNARSWKYTTAILTRWSERHGAGSKPWEEEKNGRNKQNIHRINEIEVDWENEPESIM